MIPFWFWHMATWEPVPSPCLICGEVIVGIQRDMVLSQPDDLSFYWTCRCGRMLWESDPFPKVMGDAIRGSRRGLLEPDGAR